MLTWYIGLINTWFEHNPVGLAVVFLISVVFIRLIPWLYRYLSGRRKKEHDSIAQSRKRIEEMHAHLERINGSVSEHHKNRRIHRDVGELVTCEQLEKAETRITGNFIKLETKNEANAQRMFDKIDALSEKVSRTEGRLNGSGA